jgi:hypothetical protein
MPQCRWDVHVCVCMYVCVCVCVCAGTGTGMLGPLPRIPLVSVCVHQRSDPYVCGCVCMRACIYIPLSLCCSYSGERKSRAQYVWMSGLAPNATALAAANTPFAATVCVVRRPPPHTHTHVRRHARTRLSSHPLSLLVAVCLSLCLFLSVKVSTYIRLSLS